MLVITNHTLLITLNPSVIIERGRTKCLCTNRVQYLQFNTTFQARFVFVMNLMDTIVSCHHCSGPCRSSCVSSRANPFLPNRFAHYQGSFDRKIKSWIKKSLHYFAEMSSSYFFLKRIDYFWSWQCWGEKRKKLPTVLLPKKNNLVLLKKGNNKGEWVTFLNDTFRAGL